MKDKLIGIPLFGKMAFRTFHGGHFVSRLRLSGFEPVYLTEKQATSGGLEGLRYQELPASPSVPRLESGLLRPYRRFVTRTETTELHFRDLIYRLTSGDQPIGPSLRYLCALSVLRRFKSLRASSVALSKALVNYPAWENLLAHADFDGFLVPGIGSYGFEKTNALVYEAQRNGRPVLSCVSNYDNILSRGYRGFMPDHVAVWSYVMADDVHRLNDIPKSRISVVGPVQFDRYFCRPKISRASFLESCGLDPNRKTILYAGSTNTLDLLHYMEMLLNKTREYYGSDFNIIIRPHPDQRIMISPAISACKKLALLRGDKVYVSDPCRLSADTLQPDPDLDELTALLHYSDVLINHYSTLGLEAAICNLPTIYVDYDLFTHGFNVKAMNWWYRQTSHNRRELRLRAATIVRSDEELFRAVVSYAENREKLATERAEYAMSECGYLDGLSTQRLCELMRKVIT